MKSLHVLYGFFLTAFVIAFSPSVFAGQPAWVSGDSAAYPGELYLVGRGTGSTADEAQNRARGDLATIFEVRIEVNNASTITVAQSGSREQVSKQATQQVSAKTDRVISGVSIAEVWRDPVTRDFHALAVLSRSQAGTSLREELSITDAEVQQYIASSQSANDPLLKIAALTHALDASIRREGFQASLKIVDKSGRGIEAPVSQVQVQAKLGDALQHIRISPSTIEDAGSAEFASILKGGLAATGVLAANPADADFLLTGKLVMTDLGLRANWYWMRASVEVSLVEKATGRVRGSKTWPVKSSALDAKTARSRALLEVEKLLKQELRAAIIGFAAN